MDVGSSKYHPFKGKFIDNEEHETSFTWVGVFQLGYLGEEMKIPMTCILPVCEYSITIPLEYINL